MRAPSLGTATISGHTLTYTSSHPTQSRLDTLDFVADDGALTSAPATITIDTDRRNCLGDTCSNTSPQLLHELFLVALVDGATEGLLEDQVRAYDANLDALTFTLNSGPPGLTVDPATGDIRWLATRDDVGRHPFNVRVDDGVGGSDTNTYYVDITYDGSNAAPRILSTPVYYTHHGDPYSYDVDAVDPEAHVISYSLDTAPLGVSIDSVSGVISGIPEDLGGYPVTVRATDGLGAFDTQTYMLLVYGDGPRIISDPIIVSVRRIASLTIAPQFVEPVG